jgi:hypothetical protein
VSKRTDEVKCCNEFREQSAIPDLSARQYVSDTECAISCQRRTKEICASWVMPTKSTPFDSEFVRISETETLPPAVICLHGCFDRPQRFDIEVTSIRNDRGTTKLAK